MAANITQRAMAVVMYGLEVDRLIGAALTSIHGRGTNMGGTNRRSAYYLLCGPGPFAPIEELRRYLAELAKLPDNPEVVAEREDVQGYLDRRE